MNADHVSLIAIIVALSAAGIATYRQRFGNVSMTREKQLELKIHHLDATVQTLLDDRTAAQIRIKALEVSLAKAEDALDKANERIRQLEYQIELQKPVTPKPVSKTILLVAVGPGPGLLIDLASLRKVQQFQINRLLPASKANLKRYLERHRKSGSPIRYVHMAVHSGPEGVILEDGIADGMWLSEHLRDVEILLLAGCSGDIVADFLGVVDAVVSMREDVNDHDATIFSEVFWIAISKGLTASEAFDEALTRCPASVAEFAELHL